MEEERSHLRIIQKYRIGVAPISNLFLCGTDQGFLGIVGSMLSGIAMANAHGCDKGFSEL